MTLRCSRTIATIPIAILYAMCCAAPALAHAEQDIGPYHVEIGWASEPTYVGQQNAIEVIVRDGSDKAVTDLADGDLKVVVTTAGQDSDALSLAPAFTDEDGIPGDYRAAIMPTAVGDYTFHVTGAIHEQAVDVTLTSSESTFDAVQGTTGIEFPAKLPPVTDIVTRLDRLDGRVTQAQSAIDGATAAARAASSAASAASAAASGADPAATAAQQAADRALVVGVIIGGIGIVVGLAGVLLGWRNRRSRGMSA